MKPIVRNGAFALLAWLIIQATAFSQQLQPDPSALLNRIQQEGRIRIGMYLGFEVLSFRDRGRLVGLEVEIAELLCEELSKELGVAIQPEIVNQERSRLIPCLRDEKCDAVISAVIPNEMYDRYAVRYSSSYLDTGPVICCPRVKGGALPGIDGTLESLRNKRVVILNDPAARYVLRASGYFVESHHDEVDLLKSFPRQETERIVAQQNPGRELIPLAEVIQLDDLPRIYDLIAERRVDAGIIDLGIIWWIANESRRWSKKIYSFQNPIGKYIYSVVTRSEDEVLAIHFESAVQRMLTSPKYRAVCKRWHADQSMEWNLTPKLFVKSQEDVSDTPDSR